MKQTMIWLARRVLALAAVVLLAATIPAAAQQAATVPAQGFTITGVDAHDGMLYQDGGVYYWVGTRYGCGFVWGDPATPWCGFAAYTATAPGGPWTLVRDLFDPAGTSVAYRNETWQAICRRDGCFNPRMVHRPDGAWILWFNAPHDVRLYGANQFWAMGCNGPAGPCGTGAGAPYGSTSKPQLWVCNTGGDFSLFVDTDAQAYLLCGTATYTVSIERLQPWWADGTGAGAQNTAGLSSVEGAGMFRTADGTYVLTVGGNCAYCSGTDTSYAVAPAIFGPWQVPPGSAARRHISAHSCGGQPRTVVNLDGQAYQQIDTWYDSPSETNAATRLEPLVLSGAPTLGTVSGRPWVGPFAPFTCTG